MFINRLFGISIFLYLYLSFSWIEPLILCGVLSGVYWVIYQDKYTVLILLFLFIPTNSPIEYTGNKGQVIDVRPTYFIIEAQRAKMIVYDSNHKVSFDDEVLVQGKVEPIQSSSHFDAFNYNEHLLNSGVGSTLFATHTVVEKKGTTPRHHIYNFIQAIDDPSIRELYLKFIFNIKSDTLHDLFMELGLCYFGLLECIKIFMKYWFSSKAIQRVQFVVLTLFIVLLGPNFILIRLSIGLIISKLKIDKFNRFTLWFLILMILYPHDIHRVSFIFPLAFRLISVFKSCKQKSFGYLISAVLQGFFFLRVNLLSVFCYKYLARFYGFVFIILLIFLPYNKIMLPILPHLNSLLDVLVNINYTIIGKPNLFAFMFLILGCKMVKSPLVLTLVYLFLMNINGFNLFYEVTFLNIGQGDSVLISTPFNNEVMLYDTGKLSQYQILQANLQAKGIRKIDYLILSHQDEDHDGSKLKLLEDYQVVQLVEQCTDIKSNVLNFSCLTPDAKGLNNDDSLVYQLQIKNFTFLLTGDISTRIEQELIRQYPLNIDVLKVAHHGSKTSSSLQFLEAIQPSMAIISTNGQYGHPSVSVLDSLKKLAIPVKITRDSGDIRFILFDLFHFMHTSNQEFGIIRK